MLESPSIEQIISAMSVTKIAKLFKGKKMLKKIEVVDFFNFCDMYK